MKYTSISFSAVALALSFGDSSAFPTQAPTLSPTSSPTLRGTSSPTGGNDAQTSAPTSSPTLRGTTTSSLTLTSDEPSLSPTASGTQIELGSSDGLDWSYGHGGDFIECSDSSDYGIAMCSSGKDGNCKDPSSGDDYKSAIGCGAYPGAEVAGFNQTWYDEYYGLGASGLNNWQCFEKGTTASCPLGQALVGICDSGEDDQCKDYCTSKSSFGILCADTPVGYLPLDAGEWSTKQKNGADYQCPSGQVLCGACMCDKDDSSCNCGAYQSQCCEPKAYVVSGEWVKQQMIVADELDVTLTWGVTLSATQTETNSWTDSTTIAASASVSVEGAGGSVSVSDTQSQTFTESMAYSWSTTVTESYEEKFYAEDEGKELWQWQTTVLDNNGNRNTPLSKEYALTSNSAKPQCYPSYALDGDVSYQSCIPGYYLPGYGSSSSSSAGSRRLRGRSN